MDVRQVFCRIFAGLSFNFSHELPRKPRGLNDLYVIFKVMI